MYENSCYYSDGLTPDVVDALCLEAFGSVEPASEVADLADLYDLADRIETDERREVRWSLRRTVIGLGALSRRRAATTTTDDEAA